MLVRADPTTDSISMLSFPRDLQVEIRCPGKPTFATGSTRPTDVRPEGSLETVKQLTGVDINYLITVNFRGFKQIVAKVGGVWMDVDRRYFNDNSDGGENYADDRPPAGLPEAERAEGARLRPLPAHRQRLLPQRAPAGVRAGVQAAGHAQRSCRRACRRSSTRSPTTSRSRAAASADLVEHDAPLRALRATSCRRATSSRVEIDAGERLPRAQRRAGARRLRDEIQDAVQEFLDPDVEAPEKATDVALGRRLGDEEATAPPPRRVTVVALNGNGVDGAAANASLPARADAATRRWCRRTKPRRTHRARTTSGRGSTTGPRRDGAQAAAQKMAANWSAGGRRADAGREALAAHRRGDVAVVVGQTFHGTLAPAPVDQTPEAPAAGGRYAIRRRACRSCAQVRSKVGFPLMLPTCSSGPRRPTRRCPCAPTGSTATRPCG